MKNISVLIKPASGACNMTCDYCFYCDEAAKREQKFYGMMSEETLKNMIRRKIEMLYCKRQQGHYGTEKLKTEKIDKVILSKEQWENETGKIKLLELWNCIPFEK